VASGEGESQSTDSQPDTLVVVCGVACVGEPYMVASLRL
jgi:hypothetical protein